jgi:ERF superfamily
MSTNEENTSVATQPSAVQQASSLLDVIARVAMDPRADVEKLERLLAMQERVIADQRKQAFMAAMGRVAPKLPEIGRHGESHHGKYARLEDIDRAVRPIISEEGLSMSFDSEEVPPNKVKVMCRLSHADGYSETKAITLAIDKSGSKNDAQAVLSTIAYGRRGLTKMFFNLIEAGEDLDGNNPALINEEQAREINTLIVDTKSNMAKFLKLIAGTERIEDIPARDFKRVINALEEKQRGMKK